jgi:hypothetical protein
VDGFATQQLIALILDGVSIEEKLLRVARFARIARRRLVTTRDIKRPRALGVLKVGLENLTQVGSQ